VDEKSALFFCCFLVVLMNRKLWFLKIRFFWMKYRLCKTLWKKWKTTGKYGKLVENSVENLRNGDKNFRYAEKAMKENFHF
jgi:hypothetical protein